MTLGQCSVPTDSLSLKSCLGKATARQVSHFSAGLGGQEGEILQSKIIRQKKKKKPNVKRKQAVATGKHISLKTLQEVMLL